ncbi:uncharacterized protein LOC125073230 [Vanessa atalanta]|uniref:uncharacterized protein LOC125073230 n=1 Tax=Vanessa atalanta TaxID=42275 RepID=UPI001FCD2EFF|nr:uncharacterized protein LOC125073230 [Vanessa atalanta]
MDKDMYYYSDAIFQLEINLHNVRKELISMLDYFEQADCLECYQLKCKCINETKSESGKSDAILIDSIDKEETKAPPAASLPKPKFDVPSDEESPGPSTPEKVTQDIEAWIDASKKVEDGEEHVIVKETPLLSLTENLLLVDKQKKPQVAINYVSNGSVVEAFFKYFKVPSNTAVTYVSAKLAAACSNSVKQNYTYF